jgi:hypothetical protein
MIFTDWILVQAGRNDAIGDLGNDVKHDGQRPAGIPNGYANWYSYLKDRNADQIVLLTLRLAWLEYRAAPKPHKETVEATAPYAICTACAYPLGNSLDVYERDGNVLCFSCYMEGEDDE